ncbi:hypothetical protein L6452_38690 [Arctium lappa]|uniref:Uncharacterized protein n=1 Tax=Arctium lappa TaxID=4217 RepID=A0ACB8XQ80_ARCLA|nr:hypothetical protein L6452_38690 [Arctium lappa]
MVAGETVFVGEPLPNPSGNTISCWKTSYAFLTHAFVQVYYPITIQISKSKPAFSQCLSLLPLRKQWPQNLGIQISNTMKTSKGRFVHLHL